MFQLDLDREHDDDSGVVNGGDDNDIIQLLNFDTGVYDDEKNDYDDIVRVCLSCASCLPRARIHLPLHLPCQVFSIHTN